MSMQNKEQQKAPSESQPYWDAIASGRFVLKKCRACNAFHHYPRPICPFCFSSDTVFEEVAGTGVVYSYSVMRRAAKPYVIAYVSLPEGVCMMTNIVDCDPDQVKIGAPVKVVFRETDAGAKVPMFALAG